MAVSGKIRAFPVSWIPLAVVFAALSVMSSLMRAGGVWMGATYMLSGVVLLLGLWWRLFVQLDGDRLVARNRRGRAVRFPRSAIHGVVHGRRAGRTSLVIVHTWVPVEVASFALPGRRAEIEELLEEWLAQASAEDSSMEYPVGIGRSH